MIGTCRPGAFRDGVRQLARCRRGVAALEFALAGSVLLLFLAGAASFGFAVYCRDRLAGAVSAGTEYAVITGATVTAANIKTVVSKVFNLTLATNSASVGTYCVTGTPATLVATASGSTCSDGSSPGTYAVIAATYTVPLLLPLGTRTSGISLSESSSVRLQ